MTTHLNCFPARLNRRKIQIAMNFFSFTLLGNNMAMKVRIDVDFTPGFIKNENTDAMCNFEDNNQRPRWFTITIDDSMGEFKTLHTLAHEMVHVKQHVKGELKYVIRKPNINIWHKKIVDETKIDYYDLPWEIEAHGRERGLYIKFMEHWCHAKKDDKKKSCCAGASPYATIS
jgi:hypothetical protein